MSSDARLIDERDVDRRFTEAHQRLVAAAEPSSVSPAFALVRADLDRAAVTVGLMLDAAPERTKALELLDRSLGVTRDALDAAESGASR